MLCCDETYNLGCAGKCEDVNTTVTATQDGTYQVILQTATSVERREFDFEAGDTIAFENFFNEDRINVFSVLGPDLQYITKDDKQCFSITIR